MITALVVSVLTLSVVSVVVAGCRAYNIERIATMELYTRIDTVRADTLTPGDIIEDGNGTLVEVLAVHDLDDFVTIEHEQGEYDADPNDMVDIYGYGE